MLLRRAVITASFHASGAPLTCAGRVANLRASSCLPLLPVPVPAAPVVRSIGTVSAPTHAPSQASASAPPLDPSPFVFLPGTMCDDGLWQFVRPHLSALGPISFGDLSQDDSVSTMATRVLDACPAQFTLVGFSLGGYVAREVVRRAPHRVQRLILIATSSAADSQRQSQFKATVASSLQHTTGAFRGISQRAIELSLSARHAEDARLKQHIREMSMRVGRDAYIRQMLMARDSDDELLADIRCPTLVVAAAEDRMRTPGESRTLCDGIPGAKLVVVADSGHMIPLEQPERLATILQKWLADNPVASK